MEGSGLSVTTSFKNGRSASRGLPEEDALGLLEELAEKGAAAPLRSAVLPFHHSNAQLAAASLSLLVASESHALRETWRPISEKSDCVPSLQAQRNALSVSRFAALPLHLCFVQPACSGGRCQARLAVLGVSFDDVSEHRKILKRHGLVAHLCIKGHLCKAFAGCSLCLRARRRKLICSL